MKLDSCMVHTYTFFFLQHLCYLASQFALYFAKAASTELSQSSTTLGAKYELGFKPQMQHLPLENSHSKSSVKQYALGMIIKIHTNDSSLIFFFFS